MLTSRDCLVKVLSTIESHITDKLSVDSLSKEAYLSAPHLQRLFKLTTQQSLMDYVRGRKLACSLNELFDTDFRVIDIANKYAFQHEQSYIRAFYAEYGCTPGSARKKKHILRIREAIDEKTLQVCGAGILYGPEVVVAPSFYIIGKPHIFFNLDRQKDAFEPNKLGIKFYYDESACIPNVIYPDVYIGYVDKSVNNRIEYMPSLQVKDLTHVPRGFKGRAFPSHLYVRFRYVGAHHYNDINMIFLQDSYTMIEAFFKGQARYSAVYGYYLERIDKASYDDVYCQMEWLYPVKDALGK